jgi:predicted negative regulator of RcsB-dependent stress response
MKAEKRKEIETNSLARWLSNVRAGTKRRAAYLWIGGILAVILLIVGWNYFSKSRARSQAEQWIALDDADSKDELKAVREQYRDSIVGRVARVRLARLALGQDGIEKLGTTDVEARKAAITSIEDARDLYAGVAPELKDNAALQQEAWLGAAAAEEALMTAPDGDNTSQSRGQISKVIEYLEKAKVVAGDSEPGKEIEKKLTTYRDNKESIEKFYADVRRQLEPIKVSLPPLLPPLPDRKDSGLQLDGPKQ